MTPLTDHARTMVKALLESGVTDFVVSPGSRSTPIVCAVQRSGGRLHSVVDERSAGFFALGQARASRRPSAVIATSGSAGAHYFPAVVEASAAGVPLIVVTADRPNELQGCRAPQTIDQLRLFGPHARAFFELGVPESSAASLAKVARVASQAVLRSRFPEPGAVHINFKARKPLEPVERDTTLPGATTVSLPRSVPDDATVEALAERCRQARLGLIACGPRAEPAPEIEALSRATGFPLIPEATSQLRFAPGDAPLLDAFDALFASSTFTDRLAPDLVIELGGPLTSTSWHRFIAKRRPERIVVTSGPWSDADGGAAHMVVAEPEEVARALAERLVGPPEPRQWLAEANRRAWIAVSEVVERRQFSEAHVARAVVGALRDGDLLAVSNSLPVRDLDTWCPSRRVGARVLSQRGANGIDGMIASAAGAASVHSGRVLLLVGDVAFAHDVGSLALARRQENLTTVVVDNGGGRIFELLPLAEAGVDMEPFTTPPDLNMEAAARTFGVDYRTAGSPAELIASLDGPGIVHASVPSHEAATMRRELQERVDAALAGVMEEV